MSPDVQSILQQALSLPPQEQWALIDALQTAAVESGGRPYDESWDEVVRQRSADFDAGQAQTYTWEEVQAELRRREQA
ncbi:MAG: addiction module protein [Planctomycetia bacterium]|nr:addiction module protein [Planctomycetia bacterium]